MKKIELNKIKIVFKNYYSRFGHKRIIFVIILTFLLSVNCHGSKQKRTNIILIVADDLGYGDLSCQGATDMQTPNIDRLSKQGITFTHFYANSTVCSPSRASILTGKYPDLVGVPGVIRQKVDNNWGYLKSNTPLFSDILKANGYHTAIIGKWHLGLEEPNIPNKRGFDFFKGFLGDMMDDYWTHLRQGKNWMRYNDKEIDPKGHATDIFTNWTIEYLKERNKDHKPFFLYLAYNAPHFPIQPPIEFLNKVKQRENGISEKRAKNVALIEHLDYSIGKILNLLENTGLVDNTLVIFTSDNGGLLKLAQSNGKLRGGKLDMFEGGIRVPTFFYWKGKIKHGSVTKNIGVGMDILPTVCEIVGAKKPKNTDGISLLPTLLGKQQITNDRYIFWVRRGGGLNGGQTYYAARFGKFKILQNNPYEPFQYFNISDDEYETTPLNESKSDNYLMLRTQLMEHIRLSGSIPWQKNNTQHTKDK